MNKYCFATVIYPGAEKYYDNFLSGIHSVPEFQDATFVIIRQGTVHIPQTRLTSEIKVFDIDGSASIAAVRAFMFQCLKSLKIHSYYIFSDIDDRLLPQSFQNHQKALNKSDFSYGDINLYDEKLEHTYGKALFEISEVPPAVETVDDVLWAHFIGLSALAMKKSALDKVPEKFPDHITFIDYWLVCSLLNSGLKGQKANTVLDYRLNDNSYKALHSIQDKLVLEQRTEQLIKVMSHFEENSAVNIKLQELSTLCDRLQNDPQSVLLALQNIVPDWILWFEDIFLLTDYFYKKT